MREKKLDAEQTWKQMEDLAVPRLKLTLTQRAAYFHLLRHSRLEGRHRLHFSVGWLARGLLLSYCPARNAVRNLAAKGALKIVERSRIGHIVEVFVPEEIAACQRAQRPAAKLDLDAVDFLSRPELRRAIHRRESARCFYCFRFLSLKVRVLDHVKPLARGGSNSYRNVVSCCMDCNARKGDQRAEDFVRLRFREGQLNAMELEERLRALRDLQKGRLRPVMDPPGVLGTRRAHAQKAHGWRGKGSCPKAERQAKERLGKAQRP